MALTFGQRLRELRKAKNISQRDLADIVEVDFTYLSKIENDRMPPPSAKTIKALADALGADADELTVLAGKIPEDLADVLTEYPDAIKMFRSIVGDIKTKEDWQKRLNRDSGEPSEE